ncbi:MAG TPA: pitrilysin family protein, partial [bacterium]|nr:pitrilysin family protein [bacterium]
MMRRTGLFLAGALCIAAPARSACAAPAHSLEEAEAKARALTLTPRHPEKLALKNGIKVYVLESKRLPLVTVRAVVRSGAIWEPEGKSGVGDLTGRMLRRGGAGTHGPDEVDETLDFLAADVSSEIGVEQGNVTLNCLVQNLDQALPIFADIVRAPRFDEEKLGVQKNLVKEEIRRENDNPIQIALREYGKLLWGEHHPRARPPTEDSVDALTRQDVVDFHAQMFRPGSIMIGVAGDVNADDVKKKLEKAFGDWKAPDPQYPPAPPAPEPQAKVAFAAKSVPQSTILLGHLGPMETDPNRCPGQVMMNILGAGGFTSYIVDRVRNDEGLAYAAGGVLNFGKMDRGAFVVYALSKSESTCRATDLLLEQIDRIRNTPVTDEELVRARDGILNSRAFDFDSSEEIVSDFMDLVYYGLPEDHSERVMEGIGRVTKEDVQAAARALLDPTKIAALAVGDPA